VANWVKNNKGDPRVIAFDTAKKAVMTEISSFLGKGHPAEGQIREWQDTVSNANSPKQLQAAIEQMSGIMHTQLENMGAAKTNDLGGKKKFDAESFLSESNKIFVEEYTVDRYLSQEPARCRPGTRDCLGA